MGPNGSSPSTEADKKWRVELEQILADADVPAHVLEKVLAKLDERHPLSNDEDDLSGAEVEQLRRREQHGGSGGAESLDMMPANAIEFGPGGKFAEKRAGGAMDARLARKFPGIEKVDVMTAADRAIDRRREPSAPSASRLGRMFDRFPGLANIGVHGG